jgi:hypothetical protein
MTVLKTPERKELLGLTALLAAALTLAYFLSSAGFDSTEGWAHYELAQQVLQKGELGIADPRSDTFDPGPNGRKFERHDFGNTLFMLPWVAAGNALTAALGQRLPLDRQDRLTSFLVSLNGPIAVALTCASLFWILTYCLALAPHIALSSAVALGFGTTFFQYSKTVFDGVAASALTMMAIACAFSYARDARAGWVVSSGILLALAFITRSTCLLFAPAIAGYLGYQTYRLDLTRGAAARLLLLFGLPFLPAGIWQGWYNHLRTGAFWLYPVLQPQWAWIMTFHGGNIFNGIAGVLFSPGKSIFLYSPALLLAIPGWPRMFRRFRAEAWAIVALALPYFLMHCAGRKWTGDWAWGPRYFLVLIAPAFIPAALWLADASSKRTRRIWMAILLWGVLAQGAAVWNDWQYRYTILNLSGHTENELVWRLPHAPWLDAIENVGRNIERMAGRRAWDVVPGASPLHQQAANTVNVWWLNIPLGRTARFILLMAMAILLFLDLLLWRILARECARTSLSMTASV